MQIQNRRKVSGSARDRGVQGRLRRRLYRGSALLVTYCCIALSVNRGFTQSFSEPMIRGSFDFATQLDRPSIVSDSDQNVIVFEPDDARPKTEDNVLASVEEDTQSRSAAKPRLFLHVGPQKTGSSTFQSILDKLSGLTGKLEHDNLYFRHIMPEEGDFDCELDNWGGWHNCRASDDLKALIQTAREEGSNLLLTDENLDENFVRGLRDAIDEKDWDVTVIVVYRRIHEWLVSWYNQINKSTNVDSEGNILFNKEGIPYRTEHTLWPDQGGVHVPSFPSWYENYTRDKELSELAVMHRSIGYYNLYKTMFENVLLYNVHQEGSMVTDFVCNVLGAAHACDRIENHEIDIQKINGSVHLEHDIVSVYAYEQGLVPKTLSRAEVVEAVTKHVRESGKTIPRNCNPIMINRIRDWLVDTERIMVGKHDWSDATEKELLESYNSFVVQGKMCDVDTEAILSDKNWLRFFRLLGGNYDKRNIVLHVGTIGGNVIHDTLATTMSGEVQALKNDNYTMVHIDVQGDYFDCTQNDCKASPKLKSLFFSLEGTGKNVLVSNDDLGERFVEAFKEAIDERFWNVKIVVGYTRLDQLLLMMYEREYNYDNDNPNGDYSKWPDQGGTPIPTLNAWFKAFAEDFDSTKIEQLGVHLRDAYVSSFEDVNFYAYHQRSDLVTNFVCHLLPGATNTCKAAKAENAKAEEESPLFDNFSEADILAVRAYENGLVTKEYSRETVRRAIREKLRSTHKVLSRICVSRESLQLYKWMIESEKVMIGDKFTSKRIAWINQDFEYLLESGKLCALDVEKELSDELWHIFFREIDGLERS
jgi:hypothetical protein